MHKKIGVLLFLMISIISTISYAENKYITDPAQLPPDQQQLYQQAYELNQNLLGEWGKANDANQLINDLIIAAPNFLPIYVEKARYMVIEGYIKRSNLQQLGKDVFAILGDIQKKDSNYAAPYVLAGHVYTVLGAYPDAEKSLAWAKQLGSKDPWLNNNWAELLKRQDKNKEALTYAVEGFKTAGTNKKALSTAIGLVSSLRSKVEEKASTQEFLNLVFATYKDPETRLYIAQWFTKSFIGNNPETFEIAGKIIAKVREGKTNLKRCDLEEARLIMVQGFLVRSKLADRFTPESIVKARALLMPLRNDETVMRDVYGMLVNLEFSEDDLVSASKLLDEADRQESIPDNFIKRKRGESSMISGEYALAVYFFEEIQKTDISIKYDPALINAYAGTNQQDKVEEYYIRNVEWNPQDAWTNGNYAGYLMQIKGDADQSIAYGRKALSIMNYPLARHNYIIALYLKWAQVVINENDTKKAQPYFDEAYAMMPDMTYIFNEANKHETTQIIGVALKKSGLYKE